MTIGLTAETEELSKGSLRGNQTQASHLKHNRNGIKLQWHTLTFISCD